VLPTGGSFPDWRGLPAALDERFAWPLEGMYFDIEHNAFWPSEWGPRPGSLDDAKAIAAQHVAAAPPLVPICSHRYIPTEPYAAGNPVFSIYQTDISTTATIWLRTSRTNSISPCPRGPRRRRGRSASGPGSSS